MFKHVLLAMFDVTRRSTLDSFMLGKPHHDLSQPLPTCAEQVMHKGLIAA